MPKDLNDVIPSGAEISTLYAALEVSDRSWVLAIGAPQAAHLRTAPGA